MKIPETTTQYAAGRRLERIDWPDGPVCPYCGERERFAPEGGGMIRYECVSCGSHRGHIRKLSGPAAETEYDVARRRIVPRFPA